MEGIQATTDRLLETADHPGRNPDGIGALVGPGPMAAFPQHFNFQFPSRRREAAASYTDGAHPQAGKDVHTKQGLHPFHGAIGPHPGRPLGRFLRRLKDQSHPGPELIRHRSEQGGHSQSHGGVDVMTASMHQALVGRGPGQPGALFDRQGIHIHTQGHQRPVRRTQLAHHPRAADGFAHLPAPTAQFASHQGGRLLFVATEFGMAVEVTAQLDQLGQQRRQGLLQPQVNPVGRRDLEGIRWGIACWGEGHGCNHRPRARNWARASTASGGQRRICRSHSSWR